MPADQIQYSERYTDDLYEYRHVILPPDLASQVPKSHLMTETEWRNLGVQQSPNWLHFMVHNPEPHVLLFRRLRIPDLNVSPTPKKNNNEKNTGDKNSGDKNNGAQNTGDKNSGDKNNGAKNNTDNNNGDKINGDESTSKR